MSLQDGAASQPSLAHVTSLRVLRGKIADAPPCCPVEMGGRDQSEERPNSHGAAPESRVQRGERQLSGQRDNVLRPSVSSSDDAFPNSHDDKRSVRRHRHHSTRRRKAPDSTIRELSSEEAMALYTVNVRGIGKQELRARAERTSFRHGHMDTTEAVLERQSVEKMTEGRERKKKIGSCHMSALDELELSSVVSSNCWLPSRALQVSESSNNTLAGRSCASLVSLNVSHLFTNETGTLPSYKPSCGPVKGCKEGFLGEGLPKENGLRLMKNVLDLSSTGDTALRDCRLVYKTEIGGRAFSNDKMVDNLPPRQQKQLEIEKQEQNTRGITCAEVEVSSFISGMEGDISSVVPRAPFSKGDELQSGCSSVSCDYSPMDESLESLHAFEAESTANSELYSTLQGTKPPCASCCVDRSDPESWRYNRPRRHAFQLPFHCLQIIAMAMTAFSSILFCTSVVPAYMLLHYYSGHLCCFPEMPVLLTLTGVAFFLTWTFWVVLSFRENGDLLNEGEPCAFCQRLTLSDSRHCKACNKCISGFDHHCKWLNMCIGSKNYHIFIGYVVSALLSTVCGFISGTVLLARWWEQLAMYSFFFRIGPFVLCVFMLASAPPLIHLLGFHIMLRYLKLTTFEYIMFRRRGVRDDNVESSMNNEKEVQSQQ